jgi:phosphoribosylaminoimidazolecarboxamide formyltransferase/IMP cyclohydrolase
MFEKLSGKALSYNNLVDVDAAVALIADFQHEAPTVAILKHNNSCGLATRSTVLEAWNDALACDPVSAFGGVLITNATIDAATATEINALFYEVLIAPAYEEAALEILLAKKQRIILLQKQQQPQKKSFRSLLNGVIEQDADLKVTVKEDLKIATEVAPTADQVEDLLFAAKCVKHLKSNGIALVKNKQLVGMGCGQTSRVDALNHAIHKAKSFGFDLEGTVMASEAFFPFPDCVEIADHAGVRAVIQPGGSIKDQDSIDYCNQHQLAMVITGTRHFKH